MYGRIREVGVGVQFCEVAENGDGDLGDICQLSRRDTVIRNS